MSKAHGPAAAPPRVGGACERLVAQLLEARRRRCLVLQGPAGSGKSTTLAAWRQALVPLGFDIAWLTLDTQDDEPARFIDRLLARLAQVSAELVQEARELASQSIDGDALERILVALVRGVMRRGRELVLVLDDLHHLIHGRIHEALQWLLDYAPDTLHLVLSTRGALPVSLARLRAQELALELDLRELRFSPAESERYLKARVGGISAREARRVHELTDGWAAGLQLIAANWKHQHSPGLAPVHDMPTFAGYFEREVLCRLAPPELELLISLSTCERFCAALCAAISGEAQAPSHMAELPRRLARENLFITSAETDGATAWYRLHPLLREILHERFNRRSMARRRCVHVAAWDWFRAQGLLEEAVRHALLAGEAQAAADLVAECAPGLAQRGEPRKLVALARLLPAEQIQSRTRLRIWMVNAAVLARDFASAADQIAGLRDDLPASDVHHRFVLMLLESTMAIRRDDADALAALEPALLAPPPGLDATAAGGRDNILSWLHIQRGEHALARQVQQHSSRGAAGSGDPLLGTASGVLQGQCLVGLSHAAQGHVAQAERVYREVLHEAAQNGRGCSEPALLATALLGEVLYEQDQPEAALALLDGRVDLLEHASIPDATLRLFIALAACHWLAGRRLESLACLERLEDHATALRLPRLQAHSLAGQMQHRLAMGQWRDAETLMQRLQALARTPDDGPFREIQALAQVARVRWLTTQHAFAEALRALEAPMQWARDEGRQQWQVQCLMLRAQVALRMNDAGMARADVLGALCLGHRLGMMRSLLDVDPSLLELIRRIRQEATLDPVLAFHIDRLRLDAAMPSPACASAPARAQPTEALSERECDVVGLLAQSLSNKKIARALGVSPETVKWHLKNIYDKLGVSGRDEAVARVRDLA